MKKRFLLALLFSSSILFTIISCSRINESTELGGGVIPAIDGVNTFDTTITVEAYNDLFTGLNDSSYVSLFDDHILGNISNDPFFGRTNAKIFMELKPITYRWGFSDVFNKDSLFLDSIVLVLSYSGAYGDTAAIQRVRVYEMDPSNDFRIDSAYQIRQQYFTYSSLLGSKDFTPRSLKDSFLVFKDTIRTANQLRIRLNDNFGTRLLNQYDTTNAYFSDSAFKKHFKGFAIEADQSMGNALMSFKLYNNANSNLSIYYRVNKNGKQDTTVSYFNFSDLSAHHNFIDRNFSGTPLLAAQGGTTPDNFVYLLNAPGSFATLKIPALQNLSNRVVHRAELIMEQIYDPSDKLFTTPEALFLDVFDSVILRYKSIPYDFLPDNTGLGQEQFGMYGKTGADPSGNLTRTWKFNISRLVQNFLTKKEPIHDFRLVTHRSIKNQIRTNNENNSGLYGELTIPINNLFAVGRVRLGGGNHPTHRMRLRIIYSKI
ncbi:MAG TPA: DUF4270 family protein [Chitinophagaceae bacterium]|nr:DUF4270 family protein [Chitinophagaceae bacterium]